MCAFLRAASKTRKPLPKSNENRAQKTTKNEHTSNTPKHKKTANKHRKISQNGSPEGVLRDPGGSCPQVRRQEPPKIDCGGLWGRKKFTCGARGRPQRKKLIDLSPPGAAGEGVWLHFGRCWGGFWACVWPFVLKSPKSHFLQTLQAETLFLRRPGVMFRAFPAQKHAENPTWA